jgi:hypothetical protein
VLANRWQAYLAYTVFSTLPVWNRRTDSVEPKLGDGTGWHHIKASWRTAQATNPSSRAKVSLRTFPGTTTNGRKQRFTSSRTLPPLHGSSSRHYRVHCRGHFHECNATLETSRFFWKQQLVYGNWRDGVSAPQLRKVLLSRSNYVTHHVCFTFFFNQTKLTKQALELNHNNIQPTTVVGPFVALVFTIHKRRKYSYGTPYSRNWQVG